MIREEDQEKLRELDEEIRSHYEVDDTPGMIRDTIKNMPPCEKDP